MRLDHFAIQLPQKQNKWKEKKYTKEKYTYSLVILAISILFFYIFLPTEEEARKKREEKAKKSGVTADDIEFPNRKRNMVIAGIFAIGAMLGYAFTSGMLQLSVLDSDYFSSDRDSNKNNSRQPDFSSSSFDPLVDEDDDTEE